MGCFGARFLSLLQAELHSSRIELEGPAGATMDGADGVPTTIAAAVNASMFNLLQAARTDWPFSTSPGGIANNACKQP